MATSESLTVFWPCIRTSADITPGYEIAGTNTADESAFRNAVYLAIDTFRYRSSYDEACENPLPKLFHEKRDDSEKVRFAIPKKKADSPEAKR